MEKKVYSTTGSELRSIDLADEVFALPVNDDVIYYAVLNEDANMRLGTASTKTRAEVSGSNAKPYKQKGTGNARRGDKKSPLLVGGGTIFGPKPRDFSYSMPKKAKRLAMKSILSMQSQNNSLYVIEDFSIESGKTKDFVKILDAMAKVAEADTKTDEKDAKASKKRARTVVILKDNDALIKRAGRNVHNVSFLSYNRLRARDLYYARRLIVLEGAAKALGEFYKDGAKESESDRGDKKEAQ